MSTVPGTALVTERELLRSRPDAGRRNGAGLLRYPGPLRRYLPLGQALVMAALPHGGQRVARRNAWGGMSSDAARSRTREDAERALRQAEGRASRQDPVGSGGGARSPR